MSFPRELFEQLARVVAFQDRAIFDVAVGFSLLNHAGCEELGACDRESGAPEFASHRHSQELVANLLRAWVAGLHGVCRQRLGVRGSCAVVEETVMVGGACVGSEVRLKVFVGQKAHVVDVEGTRPAVFVPSWFEALAR